MKRKRDAQKRTTYFVITNFLGVASKIKNKKVLYSYDKYLCRNEIKTKESKNMKKMMFVGIEHSTETTSNTLFRRIVGIYRLLGKKRQKMKGGSQCNKKNMYHCEEYSFLAYCPPGWIMHTKDLPSHILVMFYDPLSAEDNINIAVNRIFRKRSIEELKDTLTLNALGFGGRIRSLKRTKVDNVEAVEVIYKLQKQIYKQIIFEKWGYEYVFTCTARAKKFKNCEPIFNECLQSFKFDHVTNDAETHYFSGVSYQQRGLYEEAEKEYLKAIELNHKYYKAYCNLGSICMKAGRGEEAEKYYKKALQINPEDPIALFDLGCIYFTSGDEDEGLKYFCKAIITDSAIEPKVHQIIHIYSYNPSEDIQKLNKLFNEQLRKMYLEEGMRKNGKD